MTDLLNEFGQPIGRPLPNWTPPPPPPREPMSGRYCRLEPLDPEMHADALFAANALYEDDRSWTYLAYGPFPTVQAYRKWMNETCLVSDPLFFAIIEKTSARPAGVASYLRIAPSAGSIEVGHIHYSPLLKRTRAATEAMYLMMRRAFELGYRRYEWKCDALNAASRAAAQRLGLSFEGIFRQATVYKGRNRDTAWYAAIDAEWTTLRQAFENWLAEDNFDEHGRQRVSLAHWTGTVLKKPSA
jgi:RimJ/RimL family protein N-acetyltransferase